MATALRLAAHLAQSPLANPVPDLDLDAIQTEIDTLNQEIEHLKSRDEAINFYMHRLDEELRLAARLQQDFLPKSLPQVGGVRFHTIYRPAGYVSGDLYDVFRLDEKHVGFYVADAVGHGVPAALLTMFIKNALVTKEISGDQYRLLSPGESLRRLNQTIVDQNLSQATFATAVYGLIDTTTRQITFARAGHPCPLLLPADETQPSRELPCDGSLLGIFPDEQYANSTITLSPGDRLFIYTDGIELCYGSDLATASTRWRAEIEEHRSLSGEDLMARFTAQLEHESGSLAPQDDLTIVLLEIGR
jgi:sigma-B regulation protein RsbU (phosphoserine phosphatase)